MSFVKNAAKQFQQLRQSKEEENKKEEEKESKSEEAKAEADSSKDNSTEASEGASADSSTEVATKDSSKDEEAVAEEARKLMDSLTTDNNTKEIVKSAASAVGSLSETMFEVRFNPDVFQPHVKLADEEVSSTSFFICGISFRKQFNVKHNKSEEELANID